jgi:feruloyl esterase
MMKKCALFIVCLFLVSVAANDVSAKRDRHKRHQEHHEVAVGGTPVIDCQELFDVFSYTDTEITDVTPVSGPEECDSRGNCTDVPDHCKVTGYMNERIGPIDGKRYAIGFEMRLPVEWNGRYFYQANGGVDGYVAPAYGNILGGGPTSNGLLKGFAVISSDAGHPERNAEFGLDPQARLDYGYNAVAELTPMAKQLIKTYYGKRPDTSYIVGSSNGGRHAMVVASRYADQYDGFLAGAPGFNLPKAAVAQLWGVQQYADISDFGTGEENYCGGRVPDVPTDRPDITTSFSPEDTALVSDEIIEKCDALDGADDDWVGDPLTCQDEFNINRDIPTCESPDDTDCLTYGQKSVLARVHVGAMNSLGEALYTGFLWDPGIRASAWRTWKFCNSISDRDPVAVGYIFTTPPQYPLDGTTNLEYALNWNDEGFDVDQDAPLIYATDDTYTEAAMSFMTPPDPLMKKLHAKKGKLMVVHGSSDPVFSVADTVDWYDALSARYKKHTKKFARLFIVPGMSHSRGGPACDQFDLVDALVDWVEKGIEPDAITATARADNGEAPWPGRTRPLCAYPAVPMYDGTGDVEDASSFSCEIP